MIANYTPPDRGPLESVRILYYETYPVVSFPDPFDEHTGTSIDWEIQEWDDPPKNWRWFDRFRRFEIEQYRVHHPPPERPTKCTLYQSHVERRRWKRRRWLARMRNLA